MKQCTKCGITKPLDRFSRDKTRRDGLFPQCKDCGAAYRAANVEHKREKFRLYYQENPEKCKVASRNYYQRTRETWLEYDKRRQREKRDEIRERRHRHYLANRDQRRAASRKWSKENPAYGVMKTNERRVRKKSNGGSYTVEQWEQLKAHYEYRCLSCQRQEPDIKLEVDHILPIDLGGTNDITNIQPLCRSCNSQKHNRHIDYRLLYKAQT